MTSIEGPLIDPGPGDVLSRTALQDFAVCPFRYHAIHVLGVDEGSDPSRRGQAFHHIGHLYIDALWRAQLRRSFDLGTVMTRQGLVEAKTPPHLHAEIVRLVTKWMTAFSLDLGAFLLAEAVLFFGRFRFRPDLVYVSADVLELRDWKTYYVGMTAAQARREFQARFYAWLAWRIYPGFKVYRFTFEFVRIGTFVTVDFTPAQLATIGEEFETLLAARDRACERNDFPATPGEHCRYCELACPVQDHPVKGTIRLLSRADAEATFREVLANDAAQRQRRKALKAWCARNGPLISSGMEVGNAPTTRISYPLSGALQVLVDAGVLDLSGVMLSSSALKSILKASPAVAAALSEIAVTRTAWPLRIRKHGAVVEDDENDFEDE